MANPTPVIAILLPLTILSFYITMIFMCDPAKRSDSSMCRFQHWFLAFLSTTTAFMVGWHVSRLISAALTPIICTVSGAWRAMPWYVENGFIFSLARSISRLDESRRRAAVSAAREGSVHSESSVQSRGTMQDNDGYKNCVPEQVANAGTQTSGLTSNTAAQSSVSMLSIDATVTSLSEKNTFLTNELRNLKNSELESLAMAYQRIAQLETEVRAMQELRNDKSEVEGQMYRWKAQAEHLGRVHYREITGHVPTITDMGTQTDYNASLADDRSCDTLRAENAELHAIITGWQALHSTLVAENRSQLVDLEKCHDRETYLYRENETLRARFVDAEGKRRNGEVRALELEIHLEHAQGMLEIVGGSAKELEEGLRARNKTISGLRGTLEGWERVFGRLSSGECCCVALGSGHDGGGKTETSRLRLPTIKEEESKDRVHKSNDSVSDGADDEKSDDCVGAIIDSISQSGLVVAGTATETSATLETDRTDTINDGTETPSITATEQILASPATEAALMPLPSLPEPSLISL
jgi:hypothetical protein